MRMLEDRHTPDETAAAVTAILDDYFVVPARWEVDVRDGIAVISGEFRDAAERKIVEVLAGFVPGVAHVELHLTYGRTP